MGQVLGARVLTKVGWVASQLEGTPVTQEGLGEGGGGKSWGLGGGESREHQNQGPSDPQVSKVLGALCPQGVIGAQCWTS